MPFSSGSGAAGLTLSTARWPEVEAGPRRLLVVPVGSLEQHGPHLPLGTDSFIAEELGRRIGTAIAEPVLVAPVIPGGVTPGSSDDLRTTLGLLLPWLLRSAIGDASDHRGIAEFPAQIVHGAFGMG